MHIRVNFCKEYNFGNYQQIMEILTKNATKISQAFLRLNVLSLFGVSVSDLENKAFSLGYYYKINCLRRKLYANNNAVPCVCSFLSDINK